MTLGSLWTFKDMLAVQGAIGHGAPLSSCGGCGCDRCSPELTWVVGGVSRVCLALVPFVGHVPGIRVEVGVDGPGGEGAHVRGGFLRGCVMFRGGGESWGCGVGRGRFSEVVPLPRRVQGMFFDVLGGGLRVCVEVFFSFKWVRCVDRVERGSSWPLWWCGDIARGEGAFRGTLVVRGVQGGEEGHESFPFKWMGYGVDGSSSRMRRRV